MCVHGLRIIGASSTTHRHVREPQVQPGLGLKVLPCGGDLRLAGQISRLWKEHKRAGTDAQWQEKAACMNAVRGKDALRVANDAMDAATALNALRSTVMSD